MTVARTTALVCAGCGAVPSEGALPFRCARAKAGDDIDHVITRVLDTARLRFPSGSEDNPFIRYRALFHAYDEARAGGLDDAAFVGLVERLDAAIAAGEGAGFRVTPFAPAAALASALRLASGAMWVKDETGNVSGSHKARHLMGVALYLDVLSRLARPASRSGVLAIASCGNAALAAAVVARAAGRPLSVFVPPDAKASVLARLERLGARINVCARQAGEEGDPCYLRFREAVDAGATPFGCQGPDNGLTIEGGETLAYEMVSELAARGAGVDRLFIQVGGGALASASIQGLREAVALGALERMPRLHTVQTEGASPLRRAWERLTARVLRRLGRDAAMRDEERAAILADPASAGVVGEELRFAATHRHEFMWPWESEPRSVAHGILDDETYDWLAVVRGLVETGGFPIVVGEDTLVEANELARTATPIPVDHTGSAGLAGCLALARRGQLRPDERVAVLFTGRMRD